MGEERPERFAPTSGRVMGLLGLTLSLGVVGIGLVDRDGIADWVIAACALLALLFWAAMLRPRVSLVGDDLVLRNMLETVTIPLAAVEELAVRQLLAVRAGDRRYVSPALGKSRRALRRPAGGGAARVGRTPTSPDRIHDVDYTDFVENRIRQRMEDARAARGIRPSSQEQVALASEVRRSPAWPEVVGVLVLSTALVVTLL
ncbi:hypothetical protein [Nocardioides lijunqiniae]|uniref:hypothetical protein n=1 Tax=Nocardioides lijunqiniae TaxID=2760832 RepID=UPI001877A259|nr:hypothetical protein [Nocardioides lijunqiniae]